MEHNKYQHKDLVESAGFENVSISPTGVGNVVDYLNRQNPEAGTTMEIYGQNEEGALRKRRVGFPSVSNVLELIIDSYNESDAASFVGMGSEASGNSRDGMYFRLFFRPRKNPEDNTIDEDLFNGVGATKAFEIFYSGEFFEDYKSRISVEKKVTIKGSR